MKKISSFLKNSNVAATLLIIIISTSFYMILDDFEGFLAVISYLLSVFFPLLLGGFIAYLIYPLVRRMESLLGKLIKHQKSTKGISVFLVYALLVSGLALLIMMVVPQVIESLAILVNNMTSYITDPRIVEFFTELFNEYPELNFDFTTIFSSISSWIDSAGKFAAENVIGILGGSIKAGSSLFDIFIAVVISLYIIMDKDNLLLGSRRVGRSKMSAERYDYMAKLMEDIDHIFIGFLGGNLIDAAIIGLCNFAFITLFGMPYAILVGTITGVLNFIPTFGPFIAFFPCAFILMLVDPFYAVEFLIFTLVIQTLDAYVIKPLLFGDITGLRPLWVLVAVVIGGRVFGVWGMIFGIPIVAALSNLMNTKIDKDLDQKGIQKDAV